MPAPKNVNVGVAAWVDRGDDTVVIIQRAGTGASGNGFGTYALPGGWVEFGETPQQTAVREVMEEVGLDVEATDIIGVTQEPSDDGSQWIVCIFVRCFSKDARSPVIGEPDKIAAVYTVPEHELRSGRWKPLFAPLHNFINPEHQI